MKRGIVFILLVIIMLSGCKDRGHEDIDSEAELKTGDTTNNNGKEKTGLLPHYDIYGELYHSILYDDIPEFEEKVARYDINATDEDGESILMLALFYNRFEIADYCLEHGADINIRNNRGESAIIYVLYRGDVTMLKRYLDLGAEVKYYSHNYMNTSKSPLEVSLYKCSGNNLVDATCDFSKAELILSQFSQDEIREITDRLIDGLWFNFGAAALGCDGKAVDMLIDAGLDIYWKDEKGNNLMFMVMDYYEDITQYIFKYFLDMGFDINETNNKGETILIRLCQHYNYDSLGEGKLPYKYLIENGVDINHVDNSGRTALDYIKEKPRLYQDLYDLLRKYGAKHASEL